MAEKLPIVYVRGYAGATSGIDKQVDDPFYGFNDGATHVRVDGDGAPVFYQFESPLLRLMIDEEYKLLVHGDQRAFLDAAKRTGRRVEAESIWIHRFYDYAATTFGTSITKKPEKYDLEAAAKRLYDFIVEVRDRTEAPRVYLVAHSMGGLVCRCMLQKLCGQPDPTNNDEPRIAAVDLVDKFFTYATPHGGIEFEAGGGLIDWVMETFGPNGSDIFAPRKMYGYLNPSAKWGDEAPDENWRPSVIPDGVFDTNRVFCLVGTDAKDYGLVEKAIGPRSDGLVQVDNAYVPHAHRAYVHRSHSGRYGIVNSEEGYQNLRRFLFGTYQVSVDLVGLRLPDQPTDHQVVWQLDLRLAVRGLPIVMHEQLAAHYCPIQLNAEAARHSATADSTDTPTPLARTFLLDSKRFAPDGSRPPRSRYTLKLTVFHLSEVSGRFFWQHHLEQVGDWEDTLIVDVGRLDDDPEDTLKAWANWNSEILGPNDDFDPIVPETVPFSRDGSALVGQVAIPKAGRAVLGGEAALRLSVIRR